MSQICNVCEKPGEFFPSSPTRCKACYAESKKKYRSTEKYLINKRHYGKKWRSENRDKVSAQEAAAYERKKIDPSRALSLIVTRRRGSCKRLDIPFDITAGDLGPIPEVCPILGIPLRMGNGVVGPNSPSIDRFNPELGYVPGNVAIISHRANTIKQDATLEEIEKIISFMKENG